MSARNIIIYTIHPDEWPCEYCDKAKAWLNERDYDYGAILTFADQRESLYRMWGLAGKQRTMPQIFVDDVRIGGYAELKEMEDL